MDKASDVQPDRIAPPRPKRLAQWRRADGSIVPPANADLTNLEWSWLLQLVRDAKAAHDGRNPPRGFVLSGVDVGAWLHKSIRAYKTGALRDPVRRMQFEEVGVFLERGNESLAILVVLDDFIRTTGALPVEGTFVGGWDLGNRLAKWQFGKRVPDSLRGYDARRILENADRRYGRNKAAETYVAQLQTLPYENRVQRFLSTDLGARVDLQTAIILRKKLLSQCYYERRSRVGSLCSAHVRLYHLELKWRAKFAQEVGWIRGRRPSPEALRLVNHCDWVYHQVGQYRRGILPTHREKLLRECFVELDQLPGGRR